LLRAETKIVALWAVPRSVSTAFERMMMERGDFTVLHEPFSYYYYYSAERVSRRFEHEPGKPDYAFSRILESIERKAQDGPVFFKDMAYHVGPHLDADFLRRFINVFLIRDPARALPSLFHVWPDFTWEEAGYEALERAFRMAAEITGRPPLVLDAADLLEHPKELVEAFCRFVGIEFLPEALEWQPGDRPEWKVWSSQGWHEAAASRSGFRKGGVKRYTPVDGDPHLAKVYEKALPIYQRMAAERVKVGR